MWTRTRARLTNRSSIQLSISNIYASQYILRQSVVFATIKTTNSLQERSHKLGSSISRSLQQAEKFRKRAQTPSRLGISAKSPQKQNHLTTNFIDSFSRHNRRNWLNSSRRFRGELQEPPTDPGLVLSPRLVLILLVGGTTSLKNCILKSVSAYQKLPPFLRILLLPTNDKKVRLKMLRYMGRLLRAHVVSPIGQPLSLQFISARYAP